MKRMHWVGLAIVVGLLIIYITSRQIIGPVGKNPTSAADTYLQEDGKKLTTTASDVSESSVASETASGSAASSSVPQPHASTDAHTESSAASSSPSPSPSSSSSSSQVTPQGSGADAASKSSSSSGRVDQVTPVVAATKVKPNFPGIVQADDAIMVSDIRHKPGEGEDAITVALSRVEGQGDVEGVIWVIGEYVQRGTTGVMYMPSHNELKVAADGQPKFPQNGTKFQMRLAVEKKFVVKRPGFEGEELVGVRVGVVDKSSGKIHIAKISMKQIQKRTAVKRAKVTDQ